MSNFTASPTAASNPFYDMYKDVGRSIVFILPALALNSIAIPGIIMNVGLIYITIKHKTLRNSCNYLLALYSFYEVCHQSMHLTFLVVALSGLNFIPIQWVWLSDSKRKGCSGSAVCSSA